MSTKYSSEFLKEQNGEWNSPKGKVKVSWQYPKKSEGLTKDELIELKIYIKHSGVNKALQDNLVLKYSNYRTKKTRHRKREAIFEDFKQPQGSDNNPDHVVFHYVPLSEGSECLASEIYESSQTISGKPWYIGLKEYFEKGLTDNEDVVDDLL